MMDEDIEDIKKLEQVLKTETENEDDYDDFLNYSISDDEEQLEDFDSDGSIVDFNEVDIGHIEATPSTSFSSDATNFHSDINAVKYYLSQEEIKVINSCKDEKLKRLLVLNRARNVQMKNVRCKLFEALRQSAANIKEIEDKMKDYWKRSRYPGKSIIPRLGHPYFKTKDGYSSKPNADLIKKRANKEISLDYLPLVTRWTLEDQIILKRAVVFQQLNSTINSLENNVTDLRKAKDEVSDEATRDMIENSIVEAQMELEKLKEGGSVEPPPLNHCDAINWRTISNIDLRGRHSHFSCKAFWNISAHPSINKTKWTEFENEQIRTKAASLKYQDWDAVAAYLNNNRTGFAVCVHYYTTLCDKFKKDKWDDEEDEYLLEVIKFCRISNYIPWTKVAHYFGTRAKCQIYHRYKYHLLYDGMKKGTFSEAEDVLLLCLIYKFGTDYNSIGKYIPDRSPAQLSHRYKNYLRFDDMRFGQWTAHEDRLILSHVSDYGEKGWSKLAPIMSGRNRTHVRQRYLIIKKWLSSNPDKTTDDMVRKTHVYKHKDGLKLVRETAEYFHNLNIIPTIEAIEKKLNLSEPRVIVKHEKKIKNNFVDTELIDFFKSTCKIKTSKLFPNNSLEHIVTLLRILLRTLDVRLEYSIEGMLNNQSLDVLDKEILNRLYYPNETAIASTSKSNVNSTELKTIPPNINTLIGFRSMLITHNSYKSKIQKATAHDSFASAKLQLTNNVRTELSRVNDRRRAQLLSERKTFQTRLQTLFKWPAIMSVMEPEENLNLLTAQQTHPPPQLPLKPGRPRKDLTKINLMNEARKRRRFDSKLHPVLNIKHDGSDVPIDPLAVDVEPKRDDDEPQKPINFYIHSVKTNDINGYMQRFKAKNGNVKVLVKKVNPSEVVHPQPSHCLFLKEITCDDAVAAEAETATNTSVISNECFSDSKLTGGAARRQYGRKRTAGESLTISAKKIKCEVVNAEDEMVDLRNDISKLNALLLENKL